MATTRMMTTMMEKMRPYGSSVFLLNRNSFLFGCIMSHLGRSRNDDSGILIGIFDIQGFSLVFENICSNDQSLSSNSP